MMRQQVKRVNLTGDIQKIEFEKKCGKYMVKNFSDSNIYVSYDENFTEENSVKILAGYYQIVIANEYLGELEPYKSNSIFVKGTGEVEVQQLCFH